VRTLALGLVVTSLAFYGCSGDEDVNPSSESVRSPDVAPEVPAEPPPAEPAPPMVRRPELLDFQILPAEVERGEDGEGNLVPANDPVAIELTAEDWPGRALDPVLHVGQLHFHHYDFPRIGVLRFYVADRSLLPAGASVYVQYGDDLSSRVDVTDSLRVQP
jgi:hypothetical protein